MSEIVCVYLLAGIFAIGVAQDEAGTSAYPRAVSIDGCPNVFAVSESLLSGGLPEGEAAFKALADAGVKTIISVDGATPDVQRAEKYGHRYVHLPIGYDGVPSDRALALSRAFQELPGKVYVHCHHGKHRSPAAVAGMMVCSQGWDGGSAVAFMQQAGTSPSYTGLYSTVREMKSATKDELAKADASFPSIAKVPGFVEMMVHVEELFDALTKSRKAQWQAPTDSPDIVPASVALQIMELFRESARTGQITHKGTEFTASMVEAESSASELAAALSSKSVEKAEVSFSRLEHSCKTCHDEFRNTLKTNRLHPGEFGRN